MVGSDRERLAVEMAIHPGVGAAVVFQESSVSFALDLLQFTHEAERLDEVADDAAERTPPDDLHCQNQRGQRVLASQPGQLGSALR